MKCKCYLLFLTLLPFCCFAQFTISGKVLNQADTKSVANASVFLSNSNIGGKTANDGTFTLQHISPGQYELVISIIGFETYNQSVIISNSNIQLAGITIFPKTTELNEVKVKPVDDAKRPLYLAWFTEAFLGKTVDANDCKIINPEMLDFTYSDTTATLKASSIDFLVIKNEALGYTIKYLLTDFKLKKLDRSLAYKGFVLFEEMQGSSKEQKRWQKARYDTYQNSSMHFLRAALNNNLDEEGFRVQLVSVFPNPKKLPDSLINRKLTFYRAQKSKLRADRDSLSFWVKQYKQQKMIVKLNDFPLEANEFIHKTSQEGFFGLDCDNDALYVSYNRNRRFDKKGDIGNITDLFNTENTIINFSQSYALFDNNGWIINPEAIAFSGAWAQKTAASLLPGNYDPPPNKTMQADTGLVALAAKMKTFAAVHPVEKAYLHLDKPAYFFGDTIWYKAYTVAGERHRLTALSGVLYVELISPKDSLITRQLIRLTAGVASGDIALPYAAAPGTYRIRAYTNWMRNAGPEYFYNQKIHVDDVEARISVVKPAITPKPDVQFFPEGGELVNGVRSKVAVKAVNNYGFGQDVKGQIEDNDGNVVVDFSTQHLGMGAFALTPQSGKTYHAKMAWGEINYTIELPNAQDKGFVIQLNNSNPDSIFFRVVANEPMFNQYQHAAFSIIAQNSGKIYYTGTATLEKMSFAAAVDKKRFPTGLVQFTIFSANGEPLNERTVFVQNDDTLSLDINAALKTYAPRQKVNIGLTVKNESGQPIVGTFSAAVINESVLAAEENNEATIMNNLLLTSDLRGYIEKPNYYFINPNDQTRADLDILMITQGYQRFAWKPVLNNTIPAIAFKPENYLQLSGKIKTFSGKVASNAKIAMMAPKYNVLTDTTADIDGNFKFTNIDLPDSTRILLSAKDSNRKDINVIINNPVYPPLATLGGPGRQSNAPSESTAAMPAINKDAQQQIANLLKGRRLLREVVIKSRKINKHEMPAVTHSDNLNGPGQADQVIIVDSLKGCFHLSDCLTSVIRGVTFIKGTPYNTRPHGTQMHPKMVLIVDGALYDGKELDNFDAYSIASIEVLRSGQYLAIYGEDAAGGALVLTTKEGSDYKAETPPGTIRYTFNGFYKAHEFYVPKYDAPALTPPPPDLRSTIYWNPNVITNTDGKASFNYYNGDIKGTYRVVVEGIDNDGNLGRAVYRYQVE